MDKIICKVGLFDQQQNIFIIEGDSAPRAIGSADIDNVGEMIAGFCHNKGIYSVSVFGNVEYAEKVVNDIEENARVFFANGQTIKVEVNK